MVDIGIGNICNNNCIMCTVSYPLNKNYRAPKTEDIINEINKYRNPGSITITGGEPTLRKDIIKILHYINANYPHTKINLITNARLFYYEQFIRKFSPIKNLKIITELHASEEKLHDKITGSYGSFEQAYAGIKNLLKKGFKVEFRIVISKLNYKDVPGIAGMIAEKFSRVERVVIFPIDIIGNAFKNKQELIVRYSVLRPYVERAADILDDKKIKLKLYHIPYCVISETYHKFVKKGITVKER
ncbi:radical SAM protein, partial [Candidatus Woesearchaeota archaeon]|nr:radical SAM protein [Candidatus Woesearchaeota archaeon]